MTEEIFFLDTYAIFCIIDGNPDYKKFGGAGFATTIFNLAELNNALKREGRKYADKVTEEYAKFLVGVQVIDVQKASDLRIRYKKMSMPDAIGYMVAKRLGIKFLTGDREFRELGNVEFVK